MKTIAIFDLDGTLLYTLEDLTDSVNFALKQFNLPECSIQQVRSFVGNGIRKLMEKAVKTSGQSLSENDFEMCLSKFKTYYENNMYNKTKPFDGTIELLNKLKETNIKITVSSNKFDSAVKELCEYYFPNLIDFAIGESATTPKKPDPKGVLKIINHFQEKKENCIYIGDSEVDIQTAKNANIDCISIDWGYKDKDFLLKNNAEKIISTPNDLYEEITKQK